MHIEILKTIWGRQVPKGTRPYFFITTKRGERWKEHFFKWPDMNKLEEILERHGTDEYNLYFCPLPFKRPYRRKEFVLGSNFLWADIDEAKPQDMAIPPHVLWESSPGRWAGLWRTERWVECDELEDYNKRMTYGVGADVAGWDLTQVLRVPGTKNHKYKGSPLGKLVRVDTKSRLELKDVPKLGDVSGARVGRALELYKKWEKKLRGETRSILTAKVASVGKRSEVLWKLYHQLFDAGVPVDEIRIMVKESVWNKYAGRRDEDKQIGRDIEKCLKEKLSKGERVKARGLAGKEEIYEGIRADQVECRKVDWLWWPYISKGALTIVEGDPGLGKSYFMQMVCAAVCDGGKLPGEAGLQAGGERIRSGGVYYFSVEDDPATVIVPRLKSNGLKRLDKFRLYNQKLTMDEDGLSVAEYLVGKHKVDLVVFDTLNYFVGKIDVHRANEVSQQMEHFQRLATAHGIAVVVLRHLTKNSTGAVKAAYRGQGSIAFSGAAREVLTVGLHPDDHDLKIVAVTKLNLEAIPRAVGYKILRNGDGSSRFEWSKDLYDVTSDDIIDVRPTGKKAESLDEAKKFLESELSGRAVESSELEKNAEAAGISLKTLRRAKNELGVKAEKRGFKPTRWFWRLP